MPTDDHQNGRALTPEERARFSELEDELRDALGSLRRAGLDAGRALRAIRDEGLYREEYSSFAEYCVAVWGFTRQRAYQLIDFADKHDELTEAGAPPPLREAHVRPLNRLRTPELRVRAWNQACEAAEEQGRSVTSALVDDAVTTIEREAEEFARTVISDLVVLGDDEPLDGDEFIGADDGAYGIYIHNAELRSPAKFSETNDSVGWALWTWGIVSGCGHGCEWCYARDMATNPFFGQNYPYGFAPTFYPHRLHAPRHTTIPARLRDDPAARRVFVASMGDLFGRWVPRWIIEAVLAEVRANPNWIFIFLTKFPQRLAEFEWPDNAWVGCSVTEQHQMEVAERAFARFEAAVKWISFEPLLAPITPTRLDLFDWLVLGGLSATRETAAQQPEWGWVESLWRRAREAGCAVFWKENLEVRPQEMPTPRLVTAGGLVTAG